LVFSKEILNFDVRLVDLEFKNCKTINFSEDETAWMNLSSPSFLLRRDFAFVFPNNNFGGNAGTLLLSSFGFFEMMVESWKNSLTREF
jgi:hypothetical protein